ncbi:Ecotropic viral integration site 5 [Choanephora cucurbitarum]|uniref:Ecotropic viral integration site 5 n=1 Tax=Choanephora cucurbitarum TaxID=101091 RepID=A0A1C7NH52_9FUNG|nr:Ecotropic viral integration site 5 [Choanephora cucurbitarum]
MTTTVVDHLISQQADSFTLFPNDSTNCHSCFNESNSHIHSISEEPLHGDSSSLSSFDEPNLYFERPIRASSENTALSSVYSLKEEEEECEDTMATIPLENSDTITTIENETNNNRQHHNDMQLESPLPTLKEEQPKRSEQSIRPLKIVTSDQKKPLETNSRMSLTECDSGSRRQSTDNGSICSTSSSTSKSIFALWSPFRASSSSLISSSSSISSSKRLSKQNSAPSLSSPPRPSASFAARQSMLGRSTSIITPLPGFQEALLAQMEQLNKSNVNDPKTKAFKHIKRQSIRLNLVSQNKGSEFDWDFWTSVIDEPQNLIKTNKDLIQHIRFGIPPSIRGMVWQLLAKSKDQALVEHYMDLLKLVSPYDKMIQRDLARTFPGHTYFKDTDGQGQEGLYNVVRAYSSYDNEVGYCQGLAFIVGPMLLNMPQEDAFCVLIQLMNQYGLRGHFTPEMDGLQLRLYQFDALVQEHLPHVARHLKQQGVNSTMYASQWFMTLFAYKFPFNLVYRIYDVIFAEGISVIFKFAIALLKRNQTTILSYDFEHLLNFLKNGLFEEYKDDDRKFVSDACELEISAKRILQLERDYKQQVQKEQADANLMNELHKSNALLKKKLKTLEEKTATLRSEHEDVCDQLKGTHEQLEVLKDENHTIRTQISSLQAAVDEVPEKIEAKTKDQFEALCSENGQLIGKNSTLEDELQKAEAVLIDMKIRYAQSENDKEELNKRLHELKKLINF